MKEKKKIMNSKTSSSSSSLKKNDLDEKLEKMDELVDEIKATCENPFAKAREWEDEEREEYLKELRDEPCPLWMDEEELAEARKNGNKKLKALEEMIYDQDPDVLADQFREQGNDYFKRGKKCWEGAVKCYSDGIEQAKKGLGDEEFLKEGEGKEEDLKNVLAKLYSNRALVNLKLKNYRWVVADCQDAVKLDPSNPKNYYRAAKACEGLRRYKRGLQILAQGEANVEGGHHESLSKLRVRLEPKRAEQLRRKKKDRKLLRQEKKRQEMINMALRVRKIQRTPILFEAMRQYEGEPSLDAQGVMHWPLLFLYEEYGQSDFVKETTEQDMIHAHLEEIFPCKLDLKGQGRSNVCLASWDTDRAYTLERIVVYVRLRCTTRRNKEDKEQRWLRVHIGTTLLQVITHEECEVPGFPVFWVMASETEHHRQFLKKWKGQIVDIHPCVS